MASVVAASALFGAVATGAARLPVSRSRARALRIVVALLLALNARAFPGVWQCVGFSRRRPESYSIRCFKTILTTRIRARLLRLGLKSALPPQSRALELGIEPRWQWNASIGQSPFDMRLVRNDVVDLASADFNLHVRRPLRGLR